MPISSNNKRLLANTAYMYGRMAFAMFVSFFTTRMVLRVLGVENYGLVNVIGGVVGMFSFISITLGTACGRFFTYELGRNDETRLNQMFSMMLLLYAGAAIVMLFLFETIGSWYMARRLVCSIERLHAAKVFFQITVATVLINWFSVPFSALIMSYENFSLYSMLSIVDVLLKLAAAVGVIFVRNCDSLIAYGLLVMTGAVIHASLYIGITRKRYPVSHYRFFVERKAFVEICKFNGWRMFGVFSWMTSDTLVNLLLNAYFGPVVNAARAIAIQLNGSVRMFTANFLTATNPQLIKLWSAEDRKSFYLLLQRASKLGYFLVFFFALPLFVELPVFLEWWLKTVPEHAMVFTRLVLVSALPNTFVLPLETAAQAVGRIGLVEGFGNGMLLLMWPASWIALRLGCQPEAVFAIAIVIACIRTTMYFLVVMRLVGLSKRKFFKAVFLRLAWPSIASAAIVYGMSRLFSPGGVQFVAVGSVSVVSTFLLFGGFALDAHERSIVRLEIRRRLLKGI